MRATSCKVLRLRFVKMILITTEREFGALQRPLALLLHVHLRIQIPKMAKLPVAMEICKTVDAGKRYN